MAKRLTIIVIMVLVGVAVVPSVATAESAPIRDLTGYTYEDLDHDGFFSSADRPISLVIVQLYRDNAPRGVWNENDVWLNSVRSNADGLYRLANLTSGSYLIVQLTPTGYNCATGETISLDLGGATSLEAEQFSFGNIYDELYPTLGFRTFLPSMQK